MVLIRVIHCLVCSRGRPRAAPAWVVPVPGAGARSEVVVGDGPGAVGGVDVVAVGVVLVVAGVVLVVVPVDVVAVVVVVVVVVVAAVVVVRGI